MIFSVNRKFFSNFAIITSNVMIKTHMNFLRLAAVLCTVLYIINICEPLSARDEVSVPCPDSVALSIAREAPDVAAVRAKYAAELEQGRAANILQGPEMDFDYKFNSAGGPDKWGVSIGQAFDWPGVYGARREAAGYRAEALGRLYRGALLDRAYEVKQLLVKLSVARSHMSTLQQAEYAEQQLAEAYAGAFDRGEATILDVSKIRLQIFEIANLVAAAEATLHDIEASLRAYGADPDKIVLPEVTDNAVLKPYEYYRELLLANDPTIAAASSLAGAASAEVKVARRSALPSFKLAYTHDFEENVHFNGFSVGISFPAWSRRKSVRAAEAEHEAALMEADDYAMRVNARLMSDYARCQTLNRRIDDARSTFASDDYPALLKKALDARRISLYEYLNSYREYYQSKTAYIELCGELAAGIASLSRYDILEP